MSGNDERLFKYNFENGINFPSCVHCEDFRFWKCKGNEKLIYFNSFNYHIGSKLKSVVAYWDETFQEILVIGRVPNEEEINKIDGMLCNLCAQLLPFSQQEEEKRKVIHYIRWLKTKERLFKNI